MLCPVINLVVGQLPGRLTEKVEVDFCSDTSLIGSTPHFSKRQAAEESVHEGSNVNRWLAAATHRCVCVDKAQERWNNALCNDIVSALGPISCDIGQGPHCLLTDVGV